jgi:hypothetical protein
MDIQTLKLDLVEKIINTEKTSLLLEISDLFSNNAKSDWWDKLPPEVQDSIKEGLKDVEEGNTYTHEQVMYEAKQKFGF